MSNMRYKATTHKSAAAKHDASRESNDGSSSMHHAAPVLHHNINLAHALTGAPSCPVSDVAVCNMRLNAGLMQCLDSRYPLPTH